MALRCERCRTSDLALVSFGVYQCPSCGRVDADGNLLEGSPGADHADSTQPHLPTGIVESGRASFAAPPPVSSSPIASALPPVSQARSRDLPGMFLATLVVTGLLDVLGAVASHSACTLLGLAVFYGGLLTGKPWARTLSMGGAVLTIGMCAMGFVALHGNSTLRGALAVVIVANAWWMYVLLRADTVAYFSR